MDGLQSVVKVNWNPPKCHSRAPEFVPSAFFWTHKQVKFKLKRKFQDHKCAESARTLGKGMAE